MTNSVAGAAIAICAAILFVEDSADDATSAPITCMAITRDGERLIDGSQSGVRIRTWDGLRIEKLMPPSCLQIHDLRLSPDESSLVVVGGNPAEHAVVEMYSWPELKTVWKKTFSDDVMYSATFSLTKKWLAVAGHDHRVYLLDTSSGDIIRIMTGHSKPVTGVVFLPDGNVLMSCSVDQTIRVWNAQDGTVVRSLTNHTQAVNELVPSTRRIEPLSMVASVSDDRTIRFWQPTIGRMVRFKRLKSPVTAAAWSTGGQRVFAGTRDGHLHGVTVDSLETSSIADIADGRIYCVATHPSGSTIAVGTSNGNVHIIDTGN